MTFMPNRRLLLKSVAVSAAAVSGSALIASSEADDAAAAEPVTQLLANSIAVSDLPQHFDVEPGIHNLENGYWGIMPRVVARAYARHSADINRTNSIWARNALPAGARLAGGGREAREAIARQVGCRSLEHNAKGESRR